MLRSRSTGGRLVAESTRRANGRSDRTDDNADQGEVFEAAQPRGKALRNARLLVRAAARAAPERQARSRRCGDGEEAAAAPDAVPRAERGQARHASAPGGFAGTRGSRSPGAGAEIRGAAAAAGARRTDQAAGSATAEARRKRATAIRAGRVLPLREGSNQGAVL